MTDEMRKKVETEATNLADEIKVLIELQDAHKQIGKEMRLADNGNLFPFDLFLTAVLNRSMKLIEGFVKLIPDNFITAAPIVRMQLDNFLRTGAAQRVDMNVHEFSIAVLNGKRIRDMKDKSSKKSLTDSELVKTFDKEFPGLKTFYEKACGYVHFSDTHFFHAISADPESGRISGSISKDEKIVPDRLRIEATMSMSEITRLLLRLVDIWIFTKDNHTDIEKLRSEGKEIRIKWCRE